MSSTNPTRLSETAGPYEARCPRRIIDMLTPTDNEHALDWRRRCLANLKRRSRRIADGDRVKLATALRFTDGTECDEFIVVKQGRSLRFRNPQTHGLYKISRFMERDWSILPVTRVHKLAFA